METAIESSLLPNPEGKKTANHKDGNKANNHLDNLEWNTHSENVLHAHETGLNNCNGENHHSAKFTEEQVLWLRANYDGTAQWIKQQAKLHGTITSHIRDILSGKRWSRIGGLDSVAERKAFTYDRSERVYKPRTSTSYGQQKLTDQAVLKARKEYFALEKKYGWIKAKADSLGVDRKTLQKALVGETFKHLSNGNE